MTSIPTYQCQIVSYLEPTNGPIQRFLIEYLEDLNKIITEFYLNTKINCTVSQVNQYSGTELKPAVIITIINLPKYHLTNYQLKDRCLNLAKNVLKTLLQESVTLICTDETIILEKCDIDF